MFRSAALAGAVLALALALGAPSPAPAAPKAAKAAKDGKDRAAALQACPTCPAMVSLPAGTFLMGSPDTEAGRYPNEGPQKTVHVGAFAIGRTEVTRREYEAFAAETGRPSDGGCYTPGNLEDLLSDLDPAASWRAPGFDQTPAHPVVCVSWQDATDYAAWLSRKTGQRYRLPTEAEWEYAARAGSTTAYAWGNDPLGCAHANGGDLALGRASPAWAAATERARLEGEPHSVLIPCDDGHAYTAPVASYPANAFGLFDMTGNVWEWVQDCGDDPARGDTEPCRRRRTRGGSWDDWSVDLRSATRKRLEPGFRRNDTGFRIAVDLDAP